MPDTENNPEEQAAPERGDLVEATLYGSNERIVGDYLPRDDLPQTGPPADAAWVDTGEQQGPFMVRAATVRPVRDVSRTSSTETPMTAVRAAAQRLAATIGAMPPLPKLEVPWLTPPPRAGQPDARRLTVTVQVAPVAGRSPEEHTYVDDRPLEWVTYGPEDASEPDGLLMVLTEGGNPVATYAPGTWMQVRYDDYRTKADEA